MKTNWLCAGYVLSIFTLSKTLLWRRFHVLTSTLPVVFLVLIFGVNSANAQYKCTAAHPFHGIVVDESGELVFFATPQAAADGVMEFVNRRNVFFPLPQFVVPIKL